MKPHNWQKEHVDGGHVDGTFWKCADCGASGGPAMRSQASAKDPTRWPAFLAGTGIKVGDDCDVAKAIIDKQPSADARHQNEQANAARFYREVRLLKMAAEKTNRLAKRRLMGNEPITGRLRAELLADRDAAISKAFE